MKIVITGATGMLGKALVKAFPSDWSSHPLSSTDLDITDLSRVGEILSNLQPEWIIHCAAYTRVDDAESDSLRAYQVNALGTRNVAMAAYRLGAPLLFYSTDYVFDGRTDRPYREWDPTHPINEYGRSKLAGEFFVKSLCPAHLIIRTSWLFGPGGSHFVDKIIERAHETGQLQVVNDQVGSPTFTSDLAEISLQLVEAGSRGTYHVTNSGHCSWFEFARQITSLKGLEVSLNPVSSSALNAPAPRPSNSILDNFVLRLEGRRLPRPWQEAVADYLHRAENP